MFIWALDPWHSAGFTESGALKGYEEVGGGVRAAPEPGTGKVFSHVLCHLTSLLREVEEGSEWIWGVRAMDKLESVA